MRYLTKYVQKDLQKKMVFLGGPRQCGKTTFAKSLLRLASSGHYFNWDNPKDKMAIRDGAWSDDDHLLIFDELHKMKNWKNFIKGYFDNERDRHQFLVTGSARLDVFRKGGDSLLGRYHYWRLHPFSLFELPKGVSGKEGFSRLMTVGGFPEPFLDNDEREARRWREERNSRVIRDDIRDLENIRQVDQMALLLELLKGRVGSLISVNSLAEDIGVSPITIAKWIEIFEKMYLVFTVRPYSTSLARGIKKAFKVYFFDNADVEGDEGARFENLVATHLLQQVYFWQDYQGYKLQLAYIRDKEKREVDFAIIHNGKVHELIEVKWNDATVSPHLHYFAERLKPLHSTQVVANLKSPYSKGGFRLVSPLTYFETLKEEL